MTAYPAPPRPTTPTSPSASAHVEHDERFSPDELAVLRARRVEILFALAENAPDAVRTIEHAGTPG